MVNIDLGIKNAVKDWLNNRYDHWIKQPIEHKTIELENFLAQQVNNAQTQANKYNPVNYYQTKPLNFVAKAIHDATKYFR